MVFSLLVVLRLRRLKGLRILEVALGTKLTFETHLWDVVSKATRSLGVVRQTGKLFDYPRQLRTCFNAYVLSSLEHCASVCISSAEFRLGLLDSIVCSGEKLCKGELYYLGHRRKVSALCLLYKMYHREDHSINEYLHHFVAARNTRVSVALGKSALVVLRCRTGQFR